MISNARSHLLASLSLGWLLEGAHAQLVPASSATSSDGDGDGDGDSGLVGDTTPTVVAVPFGASTSSSFDPFTRFPDTATSASLDDEPIYSSYSFTDSSTTPTFTSSTSSAAQSTAPSGSIFVHPLSSAVTCQSATVRWNWSGSSQAGASNNVTIAIQSADTSAQQRRSPRKRSLAAPGPRRIGARSDGAPETISNGPQVSLGSGQWQWDQVDVPAGSYRMVVTLAHGQDGASLSATSKIFTVAQGSDSSCITAATTPAPATTAADTASSGHSGISSGSIAPAVVVPILALVAIIGSIFYYRRKAQPGAPAWTKRFISSVKGLASSGGSPSDKEKERQRRAYISPLEKWTDFTAADRDGARPLSASTIAAMPRSPSPAHTLDFATRSRSSADILSSSPTTGTGLHRSASTGTNLTRSASTGTLFQGMKRKPVPAYLQSHFSVSTEDADEREWQAAAHAHHSVGTFGFNGGSSQVADRDGSVRTDAPRSRNPSFARSMSVSTSDPRFSPTTGGWDSSTRSISIASPGPFSDAHEISLAPVPNELRRASAFEEAGNYPSSVHTDSPGGLLATPGARAAFSPESDEEQRTRERSRSRTLFGPGPGPDSPAQGSNADTGMARSPYELSVDLPTDGLRISFSGAGQ